LLKQCFYEYSFRWRKRPACDRFCNGYERDARTSGVVKLNIPEKYLAEAVIIDSVGETFLNAACKKIFD